MEHFIEIGLFAGKFAIAFLFVIGIVLFIAILVAKQKLKPELEVENYNEKMSQLKLMMQSLLLDKKELKKEVKNYKAQQKSEQTEATRKKHIFNVAFKGDIKASSVEQLRHEIDAILLIAKPGDEVVVGIESPGGTVHGYGLAAAQILRLKKAGLRVVAAVDLVAASGGYMMASTADYIIAAPFAIIGSIGVLAQVPNFHRLLKRLDVDYEEITSGEYKRTVSLMGEITDKGRSKFTEQITDTHALFKDFVSRERPLLNIEQVATGEYWFGIRALELKLVDEIATSDEYLFKQMDSAQIYTIKFEAKKKLGEKLNDLMGSAYDKLYTKILDWQASSNHL